MDRVALSHRVFIPVVVDAERIVDGEEMVRVTYFAVTTDSPAAVWEVELPPLAQLHGIGALGLAGVVYGALREPSAPGETVEFDLFTEADDVAAIFALEESGMPLSVQIEDVWMPVGWFDRSQGMTRGEVFRVGLYAFQHAYRYTEGAIGLDRLLELDVSGQVVGSPVETEAVGRWSQDQIEASRRAFPDKTLKLRWRNDG